LRRLSRPPPHRIAAFAPPHYDGTMSFSDTIFLFFLALILFGPKKLPEMARQAGRLLAELRRASNEFKSQIETEIAHLEVQKSAIEKKAQEILPPIPAPQGTVASLSSNPAASDPPHQLESSASAAASTEAATESVAAEPVVAESKPATSQESHV
jgi:sec-independent protein translocase protein TatB